MPPCRLWTRPSRGGRELPAAATVLGQERSRCGRRGAPHWAAIEGMYRPQWPSEILAELEFHETRKLIDRNEQPALRHSVFDPASGTRRVCRMISRLCSTLACVQTFAKMLPTLALVHWHEAKGNVLYNYPLKPSEGSHRTNVSRDGDGWPVVGPAADDAWVRLSSPPR